MVPSYPGQNEKASVDEGRRLFAHFLWSSGMVVAERIENADGDSDKHDAGIWKVKGEKVLELGAGAFTRTHPTTTTNIYI